MSENYEWEFAGWLEGTNIPIYIRPYGPGGVERHAIYSEPSFHEFPTGGPVDIGIPRLDNGWVMSRAAIVSGTLYEQQIARWAKSRGEEGLQ